MSGLRPLTERDRDVLAGLAAAKLVAPAWKGWLTPMFFGGGDATHHSATAARLCRRGLVERKQRGGWIGTSYFYRITAAGRKALAELNAQRA